MALRTALQPARAYSATLPWRDSIVGAPGPSSPDYLIDQGVGILYMVARQRRPVSAKYLNFMGLKKRPVTCYGIFKSIDDASPASMHDNAFT